MRKIISFLAVALTVTLSGCGGGSGGSGGGGSSNINLATSPEGAYIATFFALDSVAFYESFAHEGDIDLDDLSGFGMCQGGSPQPAGQKTVFELEVQVKSCTESFSDPSGFQLDGQVIGGLADDGEKKALYLGMSSADGQGYHHYKDPEAEDKTKMELGVFIDEDTSTVKRHYFVDRRFNYIEGANHYAETLKLGTESTPFTAIQEVLHMGQGMASIKTEVNGSFYVKFTENNKGCYADVTSFASLDGATPTLFYDDYQGGTDYPRLMDLEEVQDGVINITFATGQSYQLNFDASGDVVIDGVPLSESKVDDLYARCGD